MKTCLAAKAEKMREAQLRRFIYQSIRDDPKVKRTAIELAGRCPEALAAFVAEAVARRRGGCAAPPSLPFTWPTIGP